MTRETTSVTTLVLLGVGLVLAIFVQVHFGLRPLRALEGNLVAIRKGEAEQLQGDYPDEIRPVAEELNLLIQSNAEIVERARTQVGNLAHALKTPLSVLTNEAAGQDNALAAKVRGPGAIALTGKPLEPVPERATGLAARHHHPRLRICGDDLHDDRSEAPADQGHGARHADRASGRIDEHRSIREAGPPLVDADGVDRSDTLCKVADSRGPRTPSAPAME